MVDYVPHATNMHGSVYFHNATECNFFSVHASWLSPGWSWNELTVTIGPWYKSQQRIHGPNSEKAGIRTGFTVLDGVTVPKTGHKTKKRSSSRKSKQTKQQTKPTSAKQALWKGPAQKRDGLCITESAVWRETLKKFNEGKKTSPYWKTCWLDFLARWKLNGLCIDPFSVPLLVHFVDTIMLPLH